MSTGWATAARTVPGLTHDPCPGDVAGVRRLATDLRTRGSRVDAAATACRRWESSSWSGPAADAARWAVERLAKELAPLESSMDGAARVLDHWAGELDGLQREADALGAAVLENRREHAAAVRRTAASLHPTGAMLDQADEARLTREHGDLLHRVDALHDRWVAASRRHSGMLDATAPPAPVGLWRAGWDLAHDGYQANVRRSARGLAWTADGAGAAGTAAGVLALVVPVTAPVAGPVALGLSLVSLGATSALAVGAGGSGEAVAASALGVGLGGIGFAVAKPLVRKFGPVVADRVVRATDATTTTGHPAVTALVDHALPPSGDVTEGVVQGTDGRDVPVTVHDVDAPWHVGHGFTGGGYADLAVVPVPVTRRPEPQRSTVLAPGPAGLRPATSGVLASPAPPPPSGGPLGPLERSGLPGLPGLPATRAPVPTV